jgi:hypothetical protein
LNAGKNRLLITNYLNWQKFEYISSNIIGKHPSDYKKADNFYIIRLKKQTHHIKKSIFPQIMFKLEYFLLLRLRFIQDVDT